MALEEMREKLKDIDKIIFSEHVKLKIKVREELSEEAILHYLRSPQSLACCENQGKEYGCDKYELIFEKSNKYDLRIIVAIKEKSLTVVTAHIQNKKKRKRLEKWLKR